MAQSILVIEDEPSIADNIIYALSTDGFKPFLAATIKDGREILSRRTISLIVLDVGLPDGNGFEFAKEIRKTSSVPIIFVTARSDEIDRIVGLEIGADDYVVKPFSPRELSARVKAVLRRIQAGGGLSEGTIETIEHGAFIVDSERHLVRYFNETLDLSRYEYRILKILVGRPGRVFSRAQLMDLAWEEPDMSLERTVDTHVKTLRQKLKLVNADDEPIITHRGVGYSLKDS